MFTYQDHKVKTSVRKLVEFLLREGDIRPGEGMAPDLRAMQEGARLHRKLQKAAPATYQSEVSFRISRRYEAYELILEGRADGIDRYRISEDESIRMIDEIKCVYRDVTKITEPEPLHLAQAKCYACMLHGKEPMERVAIRITYCNIETEEIQYLTSVYDMSALMEWFDELLLLYKTWADAFVAFRKERNDSIGALRFPFAYRPGQKTMAGMVYQAVSGGKNIFMQAPTGVGKTISTIYPCLKLLGEEKAERIAYLTAKNVTGAVALDTFVLLSGQGLHCKCVQLTSREKSCLMEEMKCNPADCAYAKGHFDRINEVLFRLLTENEIISREVTARYAEQYQVCPYELAIEAAAWTDAIVCDYNYVFDPHVTRKSLFGEGNHGNVYLVDEAHNLLERAREMYSAQLSLSGLKALRKVFRQHDKTMVKRLNTCIKAFDSLVGSAENQENVMVSYLSSVDELYFPLLRLVSYFDEFVGDHQGQEWLDEILEEYFALRHFFSTMDYVEDGYQIYLKESGSGKSKDSLIRLFCVDPSSRLEEYLAMAQSGIFFSATLLPIRYYTELIGGTLSKDAFRIPSPFDPEKRMIAIAEDVSSRYRSRGPAMYERLIRYIEETVEAKQGNYMVFFPSFEMMEAVFEMASEGTLSMVADLLPQRQTMREQEREAYLARFRERQPDSEESASGRSLIGFAVLGSVFSEGIDLTGKSLIGVLIVGTGLPRIGSNREIVRQYFDNHGKKGYDYAYRYPGMNKVLQAAGRVIRTAGDRGIIVLLDDRFLAEENQQLLPEDWSSYYRVNIGNYAKALQEFWKKERETNEL